MLPAQAEGGGASEELRPTTEAMMAMGFTASSQIAQRLANAMIQLFALTFEKEDAPFLARESPAVRELLALRQSLGSDEYGSHARLFEILMFTDDPILLIVGADRVVRALK
eukprot:867851-Prymnesium_polylepis.1